MERAPSRICGRKSPLPRKKVWFELPKIPRLKEAMDAPPTYTEEARLSALRETLSAQENASAQLPSLKMDTSWVERALKKAWEYLEPWVPDFSLNKDDFSFPVDLEGIWLTVKVLFLLTSAILLLKLFQVLWSRRSQSSLAERPSRPLSQNSLVSLIESACREGRWTEALRLRWCLFLQRKNLRSSITPQEFALREKPIAQLPQVLAGMFGPLEAAHESLFQDFDRNCHAFETSQARGDAA
jgi:hypothetical protein